MIGDDILLAVHTLPHLRPHAVWMAGPKQVIPKRTRRSTHKCGPFKDEWMKRYQNEVNN